LKLHYNRIGEGSPLFILHGLFGSSDNWMTLGKRFASYYEVFLIDQRNHGKSPHSEQWNYQEMAADIYELAHSLGIKNVDLIGHSMGGKVGMTIADKYPDFLNKLVVADIAPRYYPIRHREIIDGLLNINLNTLDGRKEADSILSKYVPEPGIRNFLLKNLDRDADGNFKWKINLSTINDHLENVGVATIPVSEISTPTLFIRGINSNYVTDEDIMEIRQHFANSKVESIGNAGHWLHAEQPEAFLNTVLEFLGN